MTIEERRMELARSLACHWSLTRREADALVCALDPDWWPRMLAPFGSESVIKHLMESVSRKAIGSELIRGRMGIVLAAVQWLLRHGRPEPLGSGLVGVLPVRYEELLRKERALDQLLATVGAGGRDGAGV